MSLASQLSLAFTRVAQEIKARDLGKGVRATAVTTSVPAAGSGTQMPLTKVFSDDDAYYTVSASAITVLKAGLYMISWGGTINSTGGAAAYVRSNGITIASQGSNATGSDVSGTTITRLAANAVIDLSVYYNVAGTYASGVLALARLGA